jgi:4-hydroxy-tetrahydrodipicolinate synthase
LYPLFKALFLETNPAPAKAALALMGKMTDEIRLPLVPVGDGTRAQLASAMNDLGILR